MNKGWRILYRFLSAFVLAMTLAMSFAPVAQAYVEAQNRAKVEAELAAQNAVQAAARAEAARQAKAKLDAANAEAQLMEAFNAYLNMPADAPAHVRLAHEAAIERATQLMREVTAAQQTAARPASKASDAGVTARRDAGVFVWNSASLANANQPAGNTGWTVVGRPQGNRAVFEKTFNDYVSGAATPMLYDPTLAPRIYNMAATKGGNAASTTSPCAASANATKAPAKATFVAPSSPALIQPCIAPRTGLATNWYANLLPNGDFET